MSTGEWRGRRWRAGVFAGPNMSGRMISASPPLAGRNPLERAQARSDGGNHDDSSKGCANANANGPWRGCRRPRASGKWSIWMGIRSDHMTVRRHALASDIFPRLIPTFQALVRVGWNRRRRRCFAWPKKLPASSAIADSQACIVLRRSGQKLAIGLAGKRVLTIQVEPFSPRAPVSASLANVPGVRRNKTTTCHAVCTALRLANPAVERI